ncbi:hypothetical protein [Arsukibacterium sp.]|uniref:hypothetical protein n=1 Tax=Arsukibacterium sp. TaxID=1977258 RepID=UPI002FD9FDDF
MSVSKVSRLLVFACLLSLAACVAPPAPESGKEAIVQGAPLDKDEPAIAQQQLAESAVDSAVPSVTTAAPSMKTAAPLVKTAAQLRDEASLTEQQLQQFKQARELWQQGQGGQALALLQGLPAIAAVRYNQVLILQHTAQHDQAEPLLQDLAQQHYPAALNLLGIQARQRGDFAAAERWYQQALQQQEDFAEAQLNLALLYELYLWQPTLALNHYQRYQQLTADPRAEGWIRILQQQLEATTP